MLKNNLKEIRQNRGLTQAQLAERAGVEPPTVARHEGGKRDMDTTTLKKYAEALNCAPSDIIAENYKEPLSDQEQGWLETLRSMGEDERSMYLRMAEPFKNDGFEHGKPKTENEKAKKTS